MSRTAGWGIQEEKTEYALDGMVYSGAISEAQAQQTLPGYQIPGHNGCSCACAVDLQQHRNHEDSREREE